MQPVPRSITTSFITPISSPWGDFTFVPINLLTWTVVLWVCAEMEASAAPRKASVTPNNSDVFISDKVWAQKNRQSRKKESRRSSVADGKNWRDHQNAFLVSFMPPSRCLALCLLMGWRFKEFAEHPRRWPRANSICWQPVSAAAK
jgi:hypothetical protein